MAFNLYKNTCSLALINVAKCTLNQFTAALQAVSQAEGRGNKFGLFLILEINAKKCTLCFQMVCL